MISVADTTASTGSVVIIASRHQMECERLVCARTKPCASFEGPATAIMASVGEIRCLSIISVSCLSVEMVETHNYLVPAEVRKRVGSGMDRCYDACDKTY